MRNTSIEQDGLSSKCNSAKEDIERHSGCRICVKGGEATGLAPDAGFCILLSSGLFQQGFQMLHLQVLFVAPPAPYPGSESNPHVLHIFGPVRCGLGFIQSRLRVQLGKVRAGVHQIRSNKLRK